MADGTTTQDIANATALKSHRRYYPLAIQQHEKSNYEKNKLPDAMAQGLKEFYSRQFAQNIGIYVIEENGALKTIREVNKKDADIVKQSNDEFEMLSGKKKSPGTIFLISPRTNYTSQAGSYNSQTGATTINRTKQSLTELANRGITDFARGQSNTAHNRTLTVIHETAHGQQFDLIKKNGIKFNTPQDEIIKSAVMEADAVTKELCAAYEQKARGNNKYWETVGNTKQKDIIEDYYRNNPAELEKLKNGNKTSAKVKQAIFLSYLNNPINSHLAQYALAAGEGEMGKPTITINEINKFIVDENGKPYLDKNLGLNSEIKNTSWYKFVFEDTDSLSERKKYAQALQNSKGQQFIDGEPIHGDFDAALHGVQAPLAKDIKDRGLNQFGQSKEALLAGDVIKYHLEDFNGPELKRRAAGVLSATTGKKITELLDRTLEANANNFFDSTIDAKENSDAKKAVRLYSIGELWKEIGKYKGDPVAQYSSDRDNKIYAYANAKNFGKQETENFRASTLKLYNEMKGNPTKAGLEELVNAMGQQLLIQGDIKQLDSKNTSGENVWATYHKLHDTIFPTADKSTATSGDEKPATSETATTPLPKKPVPSPGR